MQTTVRRMQDLTVEQTLEILHSVGSSIGRTALCAGLQQGKYPFGEYIAPDGKQLKQAYYRVSKARLLRWIEEETIEEEIPPELIPFFEEEG